MNNSERVHVLRECLESSMRACNMARIFLEALKDNPQLGLRPVQINEVLNEIKEADHSANLYFVPEVINPEED